DPLPLALGAAGAASLVGIGSLRGWGLVLQAVLQIAVTAWLVAWCVLLHPHEGYLAMGLVNTLIQGGLTLGLAIAARTRLPPPPSRALPAASVIAIAAIATACVVTRTPLFFLD